MNKNQQSKSMKETSWFFEKINKINKPLAKVIETRTKLIILVLEKEALKQIPIKCRKLLRHTFKTCIPELERWLRD